MTAEERAKKYLSEYGLLALFIQESKLAREFERLENEVREGIRDALLAKAQAIPEQNREKIYYPEYDTLIAAAELAMTAPRKGEK